MKNYIISILVCLPLLAGEEPLYQQDPESAYELSSKLDFSIIVLSTALNLSSFMLEKKVESLTIEEINQLNINDVWAFEQKITENWDMKSKLASDVFLYASIFNPVLLYLKKDIRNDVIPISTIWLETMTLNLGITNLTKTLVLRKRPYVYGNRADLIEKQKHDSQRSFFSGHTSTTAASWFMLAKIYQDYYPKDKNLIYIWTLSTIVPAITAYLRVKAGKHFYTDVVTGYLIGAATGLTLPELHKNNNRLRPGVAMFPNGQFGVGIRFLLNSDF
tara:strand:- start:168 stop:992 length:825 start_codon:yes stop_codon:yes gene_type:complete